MRVSIVATALDGHKPQTNTVLNMTSRLQNRNNGYSEDLFSQNKNNLESNTLNSIEGATALKLDEKFEVNEQQDDALVNDIDQNEVNNFFAHTSLENSSSDIPNGVSIENASYIDSNNNKTSSVHMNKDNKLTSIDSDLQDKEITPKLFASDETSVQEDNLDEFSETHSDKLFDQENNEDEDFEIPAFLRKQKF